ncbi:SMP-30/gluconolactonase/LRE family protein [Nocardia sp. 2]|uniref:SMP-30/gluconolactonase/LRE family protein n=1 Tax=Nocardia acididurans TaxID=2802282 RepID=A0ABS1MA53_9NOCA|nr:SMP-30/gluconolactonase/LRE family protein [Nocardia acididurans]MBL1077020.1 SMP-30/gluconolactonase/LRE family protein [Nocardia acididurans]
MSERPAPRPTVLIEGLALGESPRWHDGKLWLSDWLAGEVLSVAADGVATVELRMDGVPFCFDPLPDGRLLIVSNTGGRRLLRREPGGELVVHADLTGLADHPWNEIVVDAHGNAYLNCIGFDMMGGQQPRPGILAVVTPDGAARVLAGDLHFPNGMALTPDGTVLIVAESHAKRLTAFDIAADGGLRNRRVWAEIDGCPDGICVDAEGAVWAAAMDRCVRVHEGGKVTEEVVLDRSPFACMLGGPDGDTLFVVAAEWRGAEGMSPDVRTGQVLTVRAPAPHAGRP